MKQSVLEYKKLLEQEDLLVEFAEPEGKEGEDRPVTLVTYFSGGADQGTLFLCKGAAFKEAYLKDAVNRGAVAYVSEKKYEAGKEIPALIVNDARKAQFVLGEAFYDYPAKSLHVTALTGTKGKTPRDFCLCGDILLSANQDSHTITMFQFDEENGAITDVNREISCGSPVCLVGVPEP